MKYKIFIAFTFLIVCNPLFSQLSRPHYISANFGTNIPLGEFQESDSLYGVSANTGLYYSFEAGAYFSRVFGIGLNIGAFNNSADEEGIEEQLEEEFAQNGDISVNSNDWVNGYIMLGPVLSFGTEKFIVDMKVLGGIINSSKPFINIESQSGNTTTTLNKSNEVSTSALGLNYGLHFRLKLIGKLGLRINAEGFMATQEFETKVQETDPNGGMDITTSQSVEKEIQALNLGLGLILTL